VTSFWIGRWRKQHVGDQSDSTVISPLPYARDAVPRRCVGLETVPACGLTHSTLGAATGLALEAATAACRTVTRPRPLFAVMERFPTLRGELRSSTSSLGLWHNDSSLKPSAVRPLNRLLRHVSGLRIRALMTALRGNDGQPESEYRERADTRGLRAHSIIGSWARWKQRGAIAKMWC
jgi:hypothetical protein